MATFLPERQVSFEELVHDDDSGSEFSGFDSDSSDEELEDRNAPANDVAGDDFMRNWTEGDRIPERAPANFTGRPGVNKNVPDDPNPVDFLNLFINENDYRDMANETNLYARQYLEKTTLKPSSRFKHWTETNWKEMVVFFAMTIAMGLIIQLDVSEYWTTSDVNRTPFFPMCMSRDRFWLLMSFFHLADNTKLIARGLPGHDPLFKLGSIYKRIIWRFHDTYTPNQQLSIDEGMVPWRGHLSFRVYNPDKPKKYGIKAYMLCDATNGYCTKFQLYTGKRAIAPSEFGATYDIVMDLMRGYFNQGYILFMDNYYSSPKLYIDLLFCGCRATGTLRANRKGVPRALKDKAVAKGDMSTMINDKLIITKFHDRKIVYLISTIDRAEKIPTGKVNPQNGEPVQKPSIVVNYDKYMGGVDRSDQMVSYATFNARTLKWWKRVTFHVFSLAVLNAYLCYKSVTTDSTPMLHRVFRKKLVSSLVSSVDKADIPGMSPRSVGRPSTAAEPIMRLQGQHFPMKIVAAGRKKNISRACVVCSPAERELLERAGEKRKRPGRESSYQCDNCKTALCVDPCFRLYHTYKDYNAAYKARKAAENDAEQDD